MTTDPPTAMAAESPRGQAPRLVLWLLLLVKWMMVAGVASILVAAMLLLGYAVVQTYDVVAGLVTLTGIGASSRELILGSVKLIDLVLLATVLQIVGVGLYSLFIDDRVPMPRWLKIASIADLKRELATVVIVVLAVVFLEEVVTWGSERDMLRLGIGIGAVIAALSLFLGLKGTRAGD